MSRLTHLDAEGRARMVDVSDNPATAREAVHRVSASSMATAAISRPAATAIPA